MKFNKNLHSRKNGLKIRSWPFPFLTGLTFSNDVDSMEFSFFEELMCYLNSKKITRFGEGLGLEITSSIFFFSPNGTGVSIFNELDLNAQETENAPRLLEYIDNGWIDSIHAFGDFDKRPVFTRSHASRVFETLSKRVGKVSIFSNHGSVNNIQNVGCDQEYHEGDKKLSRAYHSDLCKKNGIKFLWTDSMTFFKVEKAGLGEKLMAYIRSRIGLRKYPRYFDARDDKNLKRIELNDGSSFIGFRRFAGLGISPNLGNVMEQLDQLELARRYQDKKGTILYQHFGVIFQDQSVCIPATISGILKEPDRYLKSFQFLKKEQDSGRLWIAGCKRFLEYLAMRDSIRVCEFERGKFRVLLKTSDAIQELEDCDLQGLTFYGEETSSAKLYIGERVLSLVKNVPDETGRISYSIPIQPLESIW